MRQLSDILKERIKKVGGGAELGRLLGGLTGQAIGQYARGEGMPSLTFAIKWREAFGENLISLMFEEKAVSIVEEPPEYGDMRDELIEMQRLLLQRKATLIKCMGEKEELYKSIIEHNIKG
jgi:transcriptional regulator with XRE-family HTH domain